MVTHTEAFDDPGSLDAGNIWCLHLERGRQLDGVKRRLAATAQAKRKSIAFTEPVRWRSILHRYWFGNDSASWLVSNSSLARNDAQSLIYSSPVPICERLTRNAGDARGILMAAAAIYGATVPDVVVYTTAGCSPVGASATHDFVSMLALDRCVIHMALPAYAGTNPTPEWICPKRATCIS